MSIVPVELNGMNELSEMTELTVVVGVAAFSAAFVGIPVTTG